MVGWIVAGLLIAGVWALGFWPTLIILGILIGMVLVYAMVSVASDTTDGDALEKELKRQQGELRELQEIGERLSKNATIAPLPTKTQSTNIASPMIETAPVIAEHSTNETLTLAAALDVLKEIGVATGNKTDSAPRKAIANKVSKAKSMEKLYFVYRNTAGEVRHRELVKWIEDARSLKGYSVTDGAVRTFRKDRIVEFLNGCEAHLAQPLDSPPPPLAKEQAVGQGPQILFTGFPRALRAELEEKANAGGLQVCQTVTKTLTYLCIGPNAGPAKVEKARTQHVTILDEAQLHLLLETGELVDA